MAAALVTGATAGIGAGFARHLAAEGYRLVLVARDLDRLNLAATSLAERYAVDVEVLRADLATVEGRSVVASRLADVDLLVNNAGIGLYREFGAAPVEDELRLLHVNVTTVLELTHAAVVAMTARGSGLIINVASVGGLVVRPETATYGASKAYVIAFSEALGQRLKGSGVTVSALCPGFTHTEFHERASVDLSHLPDWMWLDVDHVVSVGLADARAGKLLSVPSLRYKALAGVARVAPRRLVRRLGATGRPRAAGPGSRPIGWPT